MKALKKSVEFLRSVVLLTYDDIAGNISCQCKGRFPEYERHSLCTQEILIVYSFWTRTIDYCTLVQQLNQASLCIVVVLKPKQCDILIFKDYILTIMNVTHAKNDLWLDVNEDNITMYFLLYFQI